MDEETEDISVDRISMTYTRRLEMVIDKLLDELTASWVSDDPTEMRFQWLDEAVKDVRKKDESVREKTHRLKYPQLIYGMRMKTVYERR